MLAPSQTPRTQSVRYFHPNLPSARRADRPAAAGRIKFPIKVQLCRTFIPLLRDTYPKVPSLAVDEMKFEIRKMLGVKP